MPNFVRDLRGVIEREKAEIGVLLSFEEPTAGMRAEAADAGFYESLWGQGPAHPPPDHPRAPRRQGVDYPHLTGSNITHRRVTETPSAVHARR